MLGFQRFQEATSDNVQACAHRRYSDSLCVYCALLCRRLCLARCCMSPVLIVRKAR